MNVQMRLIPTWKNLAKSSLTSNSFTQLLNGDIPYIRLSNFASLEECDALVNGAELEGFGQYCGVEPVSGGVNSGHGAEQN